jgi:O-methyltransferase involved in polyketide biosynthesis
VTWYDVDYPEVIGMRAKIFPERDNYRMIGSLVIAPQWLQRVPADLPALIVAEGLTMYLRPHDGHQLFRRITDHFPRGVIAFDAHNRNGHPPDEQEADPRRRHRCPALGYRRSE